MEHPPVTPSIVPSLIPYIVNVQPLVKIFYTDTDTFQPSIYTQHWHAGDWDFPIKFSSEKLGWLKYSKSKMPYEFS